MKKKFSNLILFSFTLIVLFPGFPSATNNPVPGNEGTRNVSLEELWEIAGNKSPAIQARLKDVEAIEEKINSLSKIYLPTINADMGYSSAVNQHELKHGPLARLNAEWILWDGGRTKASKKFLTLSTEAVSLQANIFKIEIKKQIAELYYGIARLESSIADEKIKIKHFTSLRKLLMPRLRIGKIGNSDIEDISIRIEYIRDKIMYDEMILEYKKRQLNLLIGANPENILYIPDLFSMKGLDSSFSSTENLPTPASVNLAQKHIEVLEAKKTQRARELYWPVFGIEVYGGYGPHRDAIDPFKPEIGAGALFRAPLFTSSDRSAKIRSLDAEIDAVKLDLAQLQSSMIAAVNFLSQAISATQDRLDSLSKSVNRAENNLDVSFQEFSRGLKSTGDMISALENLYELKSKYNDLKKEYLSLKAELLLLHAGGLFLE